MDIYTFRSVPENLYNMIANTSLSEVCFLLPVKFIRKLNKRGQNGKKNSYIW